MNIITKKEYYGDGTLLSEIDYQEDKKHGLCKQFYDNGKIEVQLSFSNDERDGLAHWYFKNGKIKYEVPYSKGLINGLKKQYFNNGTLKSEFHYVNGILNGTSKTYDRKGNLQNVLPYENDLPHGTAFVYNIDGSVNNKINFVNGEKQESIEQNIKNDNKNKITEAYNKLVSFMNTNYDKITCVNYDRTLDSILDCTTYEDKILAYIEQYREGYNSIDIDFLDDMNSDLSIDNSDTNLIVETIMKEIDEVDFQLSLIETTYYYFESNVEEFEED